MTYYMIDTRTNEYICWSNGHKATVSEKTKLAYERMYASFDSSPLDVIRFELVKEEVR